MNNEKKLFHEPAKKRSGQEHKDTKFHKRIEL